MFAAGYNNMAGYTTGIAFGYIFYNYRHSNMFTRKVYFIYIKLSTNIIINTVFRFMCGCGG